MTNTTNVFNNLKIAVIKDTKVIDIILVNSDDFENVKQDFLNHYQANNLVIIDQNCNECCRVTIYGFYDGTRFYPEKPFESWVWNTEENDWVSPAGKSPGVLGQPGGWEWNEELLQWEDKTPPAAEG